MHNEFTDNVPLAAAALAIALFVPEFDDIGVADDGCDDVRFDLKYLQRSQNCIVIACHRRCDSDEFSTLIDLIIAMIEFFQRKFFSVPFSSTTCKISGTKRFGRARFQTLRFFIFI